MTSALGVKVVRADENEVEVSAPLHPNRNHLGTAFGGSLNSVCLLACYTWLFNVLKTRGYDEHIVLKTSQIHYFHPVDQDLRVICKIPESTEFQKFMQAFERKGKARIELKASVWTNKGVACELKGEFVTLGSKA